LRIINIFVETKLIMRRFWTVVLILFVTVAAAIAKKPLIGISTSYSSGASSTSIRYSQAIERAGGIPVLIPLTRSAETAEEMMKDLDGILFTGGEDFNPAIYGESILNETVDINEPRDVSDLLLMRAALKSRISILAICRGEQLLNIATGGTLYQDLPSQYSGVLPHDGTNHTVKIKFDSRLGHILGASGSSDQVMQLEVNSYHHQAVKKIGEKLVATAYAPDGVVEAVELPGRRFVIGTQFHPEKMAFDGNALWQKLFDAFVKSAR
jgi:gamma-glutamyl-gamma-aminobutyrate hydrolase PuuD